MGKEVGTAGDWTNNSKRSKQHEEGDGPRRCSRGQDVRARGRKWGRLVIGRTIPKEASSTRRVTVPGDTPENVVLRARSGLHWSRDVCDNLD